MINDTQRAYCHNSQINSKIVHDSLLFLCMFVAIAASYQISQLHLNIAQFNLSIGSTAH